MPTPSPLPNESQDDFISRCASEMADKDPNKPNDQRLAMCYVSWRENKESVMRQFNLSENMKKVNVQGFSPYDLRAVYWNGELAGFVYFKKLHIPGDEFPEFVEYLKKNRIPFINSLSILDPQKSKPARWAQEAGVSKTLHEEANTKENAMRKTNKKIEATYWDSYNPSDRVLQLIQTEGLEAIISTIIWSLRRDSMFKSFVDTLKAAISELRSIKKYKGDAIYTEKTIEIPEEFRIPKTDIILEKGDRISVINESSKSRKKESSLPPRMVKDYEMRAASERAAGGSVEIDYRLPTVAVELSDGSEFFFQESEASDLLDEVPDNIDEEDYILAVAQGW